MARLRRELRSYAASQPIVLALPRGGGVRVGSWTTAPLQGRPALQLNGPVPDFTAKTTHGEITLSTWEKGKWVILFSYPADFTPVCTTEFMAFAKLEEELRKRDVALLGNSVDSVYSHIAWVRNIKQNFGVDIDFPIIRGPRNEGGHGLRDDPSRKLGHLGGEGRVLHRSEASAPRYDLLPTQRLTTS